MRINADFSKTAMVIPRVDDWVCSPESGVDRLMLDRIGDEVARATSIVRYAPGSSFSEHVHAKGEEFLVLEGVFSDKSGNYPTGTYVRNPPGSSHAPHSVDGCRILVKLRQFDADDLTPVVIDSTDQELWLSADESIARLPLHEYGSETVEMRRIAAGASWRLEVVKGGAELLVVRGSLDYENSVLNDECWLRLPPGASAELVARTMSIIWLKQGHLPGDS
jgi:anti-sigma factor ChrR (cupin superfamily)